MSVKTERGDRVDQVREQRFLASHAAGHDKIYRYFRRRTEGATEAEDLCAEVFRIAWEKSRDHELSVLLLFGIARNVLRNHNRTHLRSLNLAQELQRQRTSTPDSGEGAVQEALDKLRPQDREVLLLTYWDGLSSAEAAELLQVTATAVRMRLHRARKELGQLLAADNIAEGVGNEH